MCRVWVPARYAYQSRKVLVERGRTYKVAGPARREKVVRRVKVAEGGWNLAHTTNTVVDQGNPLSNPFLVAKWAPASAWGWPTDPKIEELRLQFATAPDETARKRLAAEIQVRAYDQVLYLPLSQFTTPSAWRNDLKGVLKSPVMLLYNIEKP